MISLLFLFSTQSARLVSKDEYFSESLRKIANEHLAVVLLVLGT